MMNTFLEPVGDTNSDSDTDDSRPQMGHTKTAPAGYLAFVEIVEGRQPDSAKSFSRNSSFCSEDQHDADGQLAMKHPRTVAAPVCTPEPRWASRERIEILKNLCEQYSMTPVEHEIAGRQDKPDDMLLTLGQEREPETEESAGSAAHGKDCVPCAWFWKPSGCFRQQACGYCHLCPKGELKKRKAAKATATSKEAVREEVQVPGAEENALS